MNANKKDLPYGLSLRINYWRIGTDHQYFSCLFLNILIKDSAISYLIIIIKKSFMLKNEKKGVYMKI